MTFKSIACVAASVMLLQGCAVTAVVLAGVGGAAVATDERTVGTQIDDQQIEMVAHTRLAEHEGIQKNTSLQVVSMNGSVLVVGQAPNTYLRDEAVKIVKKVQGVAQIHNQVRIGSEPSITTKTNDLWLTSKVKTALFANEDFDAVKVKVVTENGEVFLLGLVSQQQATDAVSIARNISGVNRVIKVFEYVN